MNEASPEPGSGPSAQVTAMLLAWRAGSESALEALVSAVHAELSRIAHRQLRGELPGSALQTAELVNEAYLRLVDAASVDWQGRSHFLAVAAQAMRRILVDAARARHSQKRGGGYGRVPLDEALTIADAPDVDLTDLDDALRELSAADARRGRVVELRFFGGLTTEEVGEVLGVSADTVVRDWKVAKAWLYQRLRPLPPPRDRQKSVPRP